jgi:hypothetical protein
MNRVVNTLNVFSVCSGRVCCAESTVCAQRGFYELPLETRLTQGIGLSFCV